MTLRKTSPVFQIKALSEKGEIEGYGSTFGGEPDGGGDVIMVGAYTASLKAHADAGTMPKMLWQHDSNEPIGKWLEAKEDASGLFMRGQINMDVQRGREAHALLKDECIDGLSIGYKLISYDKDPQSDWIWYLKEISLREVSIVTIPMNANATITDVKAEKRQVDLIQKLSAGDRLTEREFETVLKGTLGLSNSQAERAARIHLKGQGEPADAAKRARDFLSELS